MNAAIWNIFLNTTLQAPVHLGQDYEVNLQFVKNHLYQIEIIGVTIIDFKELTWRSTSLLRSRVYQIKHAETNIFSDSVLCVGKWEMIRLQLGRTKSKWYSENDHFKDINRIDGVPTEFEWKIFPGFTTLGLLEKIQDLVKDQHCEPEQFNDRIIFMSMYNDITWGEKRNTERCEYNSKTIADYARKFPRGRWSFLGPGSEKKWYGELNSDKPDVSWDKIAEQVMLDFSESCHPIFRASPVPLRERN